MADLEDLEITHDPKARAIYIRCDRESRRYPRNVLTTDEVKDLSNGLVINLDTLKGTRRIVGIEILY